MYESALVFISILKQKNLYIVGCVQCDIWDITAYLLLPAIVKIWFHQLFCQVNKSVFPYLDYFLMTKSLFAFVDLRIIGEIIF